MTKEELIKEIEFCKRGYNSKYLDDEDKDIYTYLHHVLDLMKTYLQRPLPDLDKIAEDLQSDVEYMERIHDNWRDDAVMIIKTALRKVAEPSTCWNCGYFIEVGSKCMEL